MKNCNVIWIFGPSGIGKKTFIHNCADFNMEPNKYLNEIGLETRSNIIIPIIIPARLSDIRCELFNQLFKINTPNTIFLIHGQTIDVGYLKSIKKKFPDKFGKCYYITKNKELRKDDLNPSQQRVLNYLREIFTEINFFQSFIYRD